MEKAIGELEVETLLTELKMLKDTLGKEAAALNRQTVTPDALSHAKTDTTSLDSASALELDAAKELAKAHEPLFGLSYQARMKQIEHALDKIESKAYGHCEACKSALAFTYLLHNPAATLCEACQAKVES